MKVFVAGASGFLGKAVVAELSGRGHEVVGLVRSSDRGRAVEALGGRYVVGDLTTEGPWMDEVKDSYRVVSLSLPVRFTDKAGIDDMAGLNVKHAKGIKNLIKAAKHGEARSIILTYDTLCFGSRTDKWIDEPGRLRPVGYCRPIGNTYDDINRVGEESGIPLVSIFPGRIYGTEGWFPYVVERIRGGNWHLAGDGQNLISVVHVGDLARAYGEAVERLTHTESFAIADGSPCTQAEFVNYIADLLGKPHPSQISYQTFVEDEGIMLAEALSTAAMVSPARAEKLLDFKPAYPDFKSGIVAVLKALGIGPMAKAA